MNYCKTVLIFSNAKFTNIYKFYRIQILTALIFLKISVLQSLFITALNKL